MEDRVVHNLFWTILQYFPVMWSSYKPRRSYISCEEGWHHLCKGAINKKVIDRFFRNFAKATSVGPNPSFFLIVPSIDSFFNIEPHKTFYFYRHITIPKLRVRFHLRERQGGRNYQIIRQTGCDHTYLLIMHLEKSVLSCL